MPGPKPGMEARVNLFGDPGRTFHGVAQEIAWRVLPLSGHTLGIFPKIDPTLNWARLHNAFRCGSSSTHPRLTPRFVWDDRGGHNHRLPAERQTAERSGHARCLRAVKSNDRDRGRLHARGFRHCALSVGSWRPRQSAGSLLWPAPGWR